MVCNGLREIQTTYFVIKGSNVTWEKWTTRVITKLLEVTHGQWLYRCIQIHDRIIGTQAMLRKEELQKEIEAQQEMGYDGLLDEDQFLLEVNLKDLKSTSGEQQEYWLVAIRAAREASLLVGATEWNRGCNTTTGDGCIMI
jgi:hypothetical protein